MNIFDLRMNGFSTETAVCLQTLRYSRVSRSLKKGQGGIQKKGTWCALSHWKRAHSVGAHAMRKRQKGYFQCNVEKH